MSRRHYLVAGRARLYGNPVNVRELALIAAARSLCRLPTDQILGNVPQWRISKAANGNILLSFALRVPGHSHPRFYPPILILQDRSVLTTHLRAMVD